MTLEEIKAAVDAGKTVCWANVGYRVIHDTSNGCDQWLIKCRWNNHCVGLTWRDNVTVNGKPEQFFIYP